MPDRDFKELLSEAFEAARKTGKHDWHRMTVAVLKNRLLQTTERRFDEKDYGADSILELVARHGDLVAIDRTTKPPTVQWREAEQVDEVQEAKSPTRMRADLWRAVLDYSSGHEYEWDPSTGQARPVKQANPSRRLPTIDKARLAQLRKTFADEHSGDIHEEHEKFRVKEWIESGLGTRYLPRDLQGRWNAQLKSAVVDELTEWFKAHSFARPDVTVAIGQRPTGPPTQDLRALIHQCVDVMSQAELRALQLPAHVLLHVTRRG